MHRPGMYVWLPSMGAKNFIPVEANMICGLKWGFRMSFANFGTNLDVRPFADVACRKLVFFMRNKRMNVRRDLTRVWVLGLN